MIDHGLVQCSKQHIVHPRKADLSAISPVWLDADWRSITTLEIATWHYWQFVTADIRFALPATETVAQSWRPVVARNAGGQWRRALSRDAAAGGARRTVQHCTYEYHPNL